MLNAEDAAMQLHEANLLPYADTEATAKKLKLSPATESNPVPAENGHNSIDTGNAIIVKVNGGYFRADPSYDPDYPGIDVDFIAENKSEHALSYPRILFEYPVDGELRALVWNNPNSEDYAEEILMANDKGE